MPRGGVDGAPEAAYQGAGVAVLGAEKGEHVGEALIGEGLSKVGRRSGGLRRKWCAVGWRRGGGGG